MKIKEIILEAAYDGKDEASRVKELAERLNR